MKKKIVAFVLIVAILSAFMAGCSLFGTNTNRDYHQVLAVVSYDTGEGVLTNVVYKGEVVTYVNAYGASYVSQLGWTAEQVVEYFYNSITRQKLTVLYALDYLYKNKLMSSDFSARYANLDAWNSYKEDNAIAAYREFLTVDEFRYCVEQTNNSFYDNWQDYIEEEESANAKNSATADEDEDEDDDDTEYLEARSKITADEEEESDEYEVNADVKTDADIVKYFANKYEIELDSSKLENAYFFNFVNTIIRNNVADKETYDNMRTALKSVKDDLGEILDYDYFLMQEISSYIVEKYTDHVGTLSQVVDNVDSNVSVRYNKQVALDIKSYVEQEDFSSAVSAGTFTLAAPSDTYIQVKSILLAFSEEQSAAITDITAGNSNSEDWAKAVRAIIATGFVDENSNDYNIDVNMLELYTKLGIKVNVSNPDYDSDEDELKDAYTDATIEDVDNAYANPAVSYLTVLYAMATDIRNKVNMAMDAAKDMTDLEKYLVKEYASAQAFNDWLNLVNDDGGMFSNDFYAVTPDGEATNYVPEYTVLARALTQGGVGATTISNYADGSILSGEVAYDGSTEILKSANGSYTIYTTHADSSVGENEDKIETDIYTLETADGATISFIVNDFGIHIVMVTELPVDENKGTITTRTEKNSEDEDVTMYVKSDDYVYDYSVKITYAVDEDGNEDKTAIESITVDVTTVKENYQETVKSELSLDVTSLNQYNLFADDDFAQRSDKVFKQIMNGIS